jgi:hypothetical protein
MPQSHRVMGILFLIFVLRTTPPRKWEPGPVGDKAAQVRFGISIEAPIRHPNKTGLQTVSMFGSRGFISTLFGMPCQTS